MRRLSVSGLVLAGIYAMFSAILIGRAWRSDCIDQHGFVHFMPLLPLSLTLSWIGLGELHTLLAGLPVSSRLGAYSIYYGLILAHVGALYGLGWIVERSAAALIQGGPPRSALFEGRKNS